MTDVPEYYADDGGVPRHLGCGGQIVLFKEGWICSLCNEDGEYPWQAASTVPTESMESASSATQARPQDAPRVVSTGEPNTL